MGRVGLLWPLPLHLASRLGDLWVEFAWLGVVIAPAFAIIWFNDSCLFDLRLSFQLRV